MNRCPSDRRKPYASGLLQLLLGEAAELRQPRLEERPETLYLVRVDTLIQGVFLVVDDVPVIVLHILVGWQSIGLDLSQRLGKVVSLLYHQPEIVLVVASLLS